MDAMESNGVFPNERLIHNHCHLLIFVEAWLLESRSLARSSAAQFVVVAAHANNLFMLAGLMHNPIFLVQNHFLLISRIILRIMEQR